MSDIRELICAAAFEALKTVPNVVTVFRNRGEIPEDKRPAVTILDGDEEADDQAFQRGRVSPAPNLVVMRPEIYAVLDQREPKNVDVGQDLNTLRKEILRVLLNDATIKELVGSNGEIRYEGCMTDLASGRAMQGQIQVRVAFVYPLIPSKLLA